MKRKVLGLILLSLGGLVGCSQHKPDIQYTVKQDSYENADFKNWQVGQWSRYRTSAVNRDGIFHLFDSNDPKGEIQLLVAAAAGDGYWLEVSDNEEHIAALIIADTSKGYLDYKVKEIKFTEGGKLKHYNEAELIDDQAEDELEKVNTWLSLLVYSLHDGVYRNVQLPAGQFLAIREVPMSLSLRLGRMSGYLR